MSGANAGRTAAGTTGIVSRFRQICVAPFLTLPLSTAPSLSRSNEPWVTHGGGWKNEMILYICE